MSDDLKPCALPQEPVTLEDADLRLVAEKLGLPVDQLRRKAVKMPVEMLEKLRAGKLQFVPRQLSPEDVQRMRAGTPMDLAALPQAQAPVPVLTPKQRIEARYEQVLQRSAAMRQTAALPLTSPIPGIEPRAVSAYVEPCPRLNRVVLAVRPPGAPSILQECRHPVKLAISQHQSPGDILMLSRAVDDLHRCYPGMFKTQMRTPAAEIWQHNPNHVEHADTDAEVMWIAAEYKLINTSNKGAHHFVHGFRKDLEAKLGLPIEQGQPWGAIYITDQERSWYSQVHEILGKNVPFWIIDAGRKSDYTAKHWDLHRFQQVVDMTPDIYWVQIGSAEASHYHPALKGDNLINLVGKTSIRQIIRLMYHAAGVLTPVSFPMHLAAAVPVHPRYRRATRPCVVIAGGREPQIWEAYSTHQFLHTCGMMPCCQDGGCWKARTMPLGDGDQKDKDSLCLWPVSTPEGNIIPKCMDMISAEAVVQAVRNSLLAYDYSDKDDSKWKQLWPPVLDTTVQEALKTFAEKPVHAPVAADPTAGSTPANVLPPPPATIVVEDGRAPVEVATPGIPEGEAATVTVEV